MRTRVEDKLKNFTTDRARGAYAQAFRAGAQRHGEKSRGFYRHHSEALRAQNILFCPAIAGLWWTGEGNRGVDEWKVWKLAEVSDTR